MNSPIPHPPDTGATRRQILARHRGAVSVRPRAWWAAILIHAGLALGLAAIIEERPAPMPAPRPWIGDLRWEPVPPELEPVRETPANAETEEVEALATPSPPRPTALDLAAAGLAEPLLAPPPEAAPPPPPRALPFTAAFADTRRTRAWHRRFPPPAPELRPVSEPSPPSVAAPPAVASAAPAPAPAGPSQRARPVSGSCPPPVYPAVARRRHWTGTVTVQMSIDALGEVAAARILRSSGHEVLDQAALQAALAWRFAPALQGGEPVPQLRNQPFTFRLTADE